MVLLQVTLGPHTYTYDSVYGFGGCELDQLYAACVQPLVDGLFKGYNATVLAYGKISSTCSANSIMFSCSTRWHEFSLLFGSSISSRWQAGAGAKV